MLEANFALVILLLRNRTRLQQIAHGFRRRRLDGLDDWQPQQGLRSHGVSETLRSCLRHGLTLYFRQRSRSPPLTLQPSQDVPGASSGVVTRFARFVLYDFPATTLHQLQASNRSPTESQVPMSLAADFLNVLAKADVSLSASSCACACLAVLMPAAAMPPAQRC